MRTCGAELVPGDDFCRECGHTLRFDPDAEDDTGALDSNAGIICPACGATHLVYTAQGHPQCESCGYMERP